MYRHRNKTINRNTWQKNGATPLSLKETSVLQELLP